MVATMSALCWWSRGVRFGGRGLVVLVMPWILLADEVEVSIQSIRFKTKPNRSNRIN